MQELQAPQVAFHVLKATCVTAEVLPPTVHNALQDTLALILLHPISRQGAHLDPTVLRVLFNQLNVLMELTNPICIRAAALTVQ